MPTYTLWKIIRDATPSTTPRNVLVAFVRDDGLLVNAPLLPHADPDALTDDALEAEARLAMEPPPANA